MKNTAELLHASLAELAKATEKRLLADFDIHSVKISVNSDTFWTYEIHCYERPQEFKVANSSESLESAIQELIKQLTPRAVLAEKMRQQATTLMEQANKVNQPA